MKMESVSGAVSGLTREEVLRRAEALVPVLRSRAEEGEQLRRCPDATIKDLTDAGLTRLCMPARYGGFEADYDIFCEAIQTLARGDGSQAWVYMVLTDNALKLAAFSPQAQEDVWGVNRDAKLSNAVAPLGRGRVVEGGVRWTGRHPFSSGVDHADWVMATGFVERDGRQQTVSVLVPKQDITIHDDWHVVGLAGTGSKTFEINDAFVPDHRILSKDDEDAAGPALYAAPVFNLPRGGVSSATYVSVAVGVAEGMLAEYIAYTGPRLSRSHVVAESMGTQITVGQASCEVEAAAQMYLTPVRETMQLLARGEKVSKQLNLRGKRNAAYAAQLSITAAQRMFNAAGGRALYLNNPMQRQLRDCLGAAAHHSLMWDQAAAGYGKHVLGVKSKDKH